MECRGMVIGATNPLYATHTITTTHYDISTGQKIQKKKRYAIGISLTGASTRFNTPLISCGWTVLNRRSRVGSMCVRVCV